MARQRNVTGTVLEERALTAEELARACRVDVAWVFRRVETGVISAATSVPEPRFSGDDLLRARRVRMLEASFEADPELAGMVADLIDEVARLRARLRQAGLEP